MSDQHGFLSVDSYSRSQTAEHLLNTAITQANGSVTPLHVRVDVDEHDAWRVRGGAPAAASPRGNGSIRIPLEFVRFEPYVIPKKSLTGDSTERVDTRVLQIIYRVKEQSAPLYVGQQVDVYIETPVKSSTFRQHSSSAAGGGQ